ncbi:hypothetical protein HYPSUDRAFT_206550, partial [Hypholoma sublateritium FD-334 SS-4]
WPPFPSQRHLAPSICASLACIRRAAPSALRKSPFALSAPPGRAAPSIVLSPPASPSTHPILIIVALRPSGPPIQPVPTFSRSVDSCPLRALRRILLSRRLAAHLHSPIRSQPTAADPRSARPSGSPVLVHRVVAVPHPDPDLHSYVPTLRMCDMYRAETFYDYWIGLWACRSASYRAPSALRVFGPFSCGASSGLARVLIEFRSKMLPIARCLERGRGDHLEGLLGF